MREHDDDDLAEAFQEIIAFEARMHREDVEHLGRALTSSRCIGMAIGIVMRGHSLSQDEAWQLLRTASRNSNRKLRDVAEDVVLLGDLPQSARSRHDAPAVVDHGGGGR